MKKLIIVLLFGVIVCDICIHNNALTSNKQVNFIEYKVKSGDCLITIAEQYKTKGTRTDNYIEELKFINNKSNDVVNIGETIKIPMGR